MTDMERLVTNLQAPWSIDWTKADELDHTYIDILIDRGVLVPVEPDYEAASEYARRVEGIYVSPEDVSGIVDAALGIGDTE